MNIHHEKQAEVLKFCTSAQWDTTEILE